MEMKTMIKWKRIHALTLRIVACSLLAVLSLALVPLPAMGVVSKVAQKTGVTVHSNDKVSIDASNLEEGYVIVKYTGGKDVKIKAQVAKKDGSSYTYDINAKGNPEVIPLTEGDGKYSIGVFENVSGTKYAQAYSATLDVKLRDPLLPFLYPNQYVNFKENSSVATKAAELTKDKKEDKEKLIEIYSFVTDNLTYDTELAKTVQSGYLPDVDKVLERKKGICFDYAALMSSMLRLQGIPSQLCVGYAGTVYHAWINIYIDDAWVFRAINYDGKKWTLLDPTFVSTSNSANAVKQFIGEGNSYSQKFVY
ncbi:MAG: transglutaminase-like domain-containing protein [Clostridiales bacterium]|nr:transglutaminase-like domain-containing protein [Clostridiales bacterium]